MAASLKPSESRGRCSVALLFRHKVNRGTVMVRRVSCGSWRCEKCGGELRQKWLEHLTGVLSRHERLYVSHIDKERWRTLSMRIRRAGGESAIIEQAGGYLVVFTTASVGEPVSKTIALSMLEKAVAGAESMTGKRPIHTSLGWLFPKTDAPLPSQWEKVSKLPVSVEEARKVVVGSGLHPSSFFGDFASGFVLTLPTSADSDNDFKQLLELLTREGNDDKEQA